jgi:hypothetical protein
MSIRSKSEANKVYKFVHHLDESIMTNIKGEKFNDDDHFLELFPNGELKIKGTMSRGYAWDGCSPKKNFLNFTFGTPDGKMDYLTEKPITYYASMVHDVIYQYKGLVPISRKTADKLFYKILKEAGFIWAWLYYFAVRVAGGLYGKWKTKGKVKNLEIIKCSWIIRAHDEWKKHKLPVKKNHHFLKVIESYKKNSIIT